MKKLVRFDWAIKYLLKHKANFDVLEGFLSELLKTDIHIETVLESESNKKHENDKFNRVDLFARTNDGQHVIIEVQCTYQSDYLSRVLYGTSKAVCEYVREGDAYRKVRKVISVSIVFFDLGEGKDYLYHGSTTFKGIHYHDTLNLNAKERDMYTHSNGLAVQTPEAVFPEYYIIKVTAFHERVQDKFDEWIYFLKNSEVKEEFTAKGIQSAAQKLAILGLSEAERRTYESYQESLHDDASWSEMMAIEQAKIEAAEAKIKAAKVKMKAAKVEAETAKAETKAAKVEAEAAKAETKAAKVEAEAAKAETKAAEAKAKAAEAKGKKEGILLASEKIVLELFKTKLSDEEIAAAVKVPIEKVKALRQQR